MIAIQKTWWAAVVLAAFAGCAGEEPPGGTPAASPAPATGGGAPAAKAEMPKDEEKPKDDAKKPDDATKAEPGKDEPKGELKLEGPTPSPAKSATPKEEEKSASIKLDEDQIANIKKLSAEDQKIALAQVVCPVSGEPLGSMDKPIKVSAAGKTFFLCCDGCEKDVKADPAKVVAKLNQK
jgi:hypothetical protein